MAESITEYLYENGNKYDIKIAYARGSYLEAVRLVNKKLATEIKEIFTEQELAMLKKQGIRWMKVGLRMEEAFNIFKKRIKEFINEDEYKQLKLL